MARRAATRIGFVAAGLDILGGQGVEAAILVEALRADGHEVLFVPINPAFPPGLRWLRRIRYARTVVNEGIYAIELAALARVDVVHVFSASYWSFLLAPAPAMLAARAMGKRVVLHYHSGEAADHLDHWGWRVHPWLRLAHEIVVPSAYLGDVFARHGYRARVIPNVVDLSRFGFRERSTWRPRLLSTRNLEAYYDVQTIVRAFAAVQARYPDATLTIAGTGSEERSLRQLAASIGAGGIRFVGRVEPAQMPALCDAADIFLNASVLDNQPVSILEAMACGLAVVSTPTGAIGEMVRHGWNGLIVPARDPAGLAQAVVDVLEHPELASAMTRRAREEMTGYAWPAVRRAWLEAYGVAGRATPAAGRSMPAVAMTDEVS